MKRTLVAAAVFAVTAVAVPAHGTHIHYQIIPNTADPWLVANNLQSITLRLHIDPGHQGLGVLGVASHPWSVTTTKSLFDPTPGSGFHNHTANVTAFGGSFVLWDNASGENIVSARQAALDATIFGEPLDPSAYWDSGYTQQFIDLFGQPGPHDPVNNWATSNSGANVTHSPMFGISLSPIDLPTVIDVYHVTWSVDEAASGSFIFQFTEPTFEEVHVAWAQGWIPGPGVLGLFALAGLAGVRRRRA